MNRYHKALVDSFPNKTFERKILYKDIDVEYACQLERQIIKRCGRLINKTGYLANIHEGGILDFLKKEDRYSKSPEWVCYRKGKTFGELFGSDYVNPRKGKTFRDYNPNFISSKSKMFKLVINDNNKIVCETEIDFLEKTKLHKRVLYKLRDSGTYTIKRRQHNTLHIFNSGDVIDYIPLTLDEYLKER